MSELLENLPKSPKKVPGEGTWHYQRKEEKKLDTPRVLEPDHPLLEKFQKALKDHLTKLLSHLKDEVYDLESGVKQKLKQHEEIGIRAYEIQQLINMQQNQIDYLEKESNDIVTEIEIQEIQVKETNTNYKEQQEKLFEARRKERELRAEVEAMDLLEFQMVKCEETLESEIAVNQRIADKTQKDKVKLAEEKRQLDILTFKLMKEVWRLEGEIETMDMQLNVQEAEREKMAELIAKSNIEIESYEAEYRCLMNSWNTVVIAIGQRDKLCSSVNEILMKKSEELKTYKGEIETINKLCKKQMEKNESLTMFKSRIIYDIETLTKTFENETNKKNHLEQVMSEHQAIIDEMDKDYYTINSEFTRYEHAFKMIMMAFQKENKIKGDIEEEILQRIQDQITNDKAAMFLGKLVREGRTANRELEITLVSVESALASTKADIENQKCENETLQRLYVEINAEQQELNQEINELNANLAKLHHVMSKKQRDMEILKDKLDTLNEMSKLDVSPEEQRVQIIEKTIVDTDAKIKELQNFWLSQQVYVVRLSGERQSQIHDINLLKKQILILEQKNLRITDELENTEQKEKLILRNITNLQNRLAQLNFQFSQQSGLAEQMDNEKDFYEIESYGKLQDIEMDCLKVQEDISQLENDKLAMSAELIAANREALEWEKKEMIAAETKRKTQDDKSAGGEIGGMKAEIHRMEVRYGQLKRVQDQLIHDLESCVTRRDSIVAIAEAREKRNRGGCSKTRINFNRKLDDMKNKLRSLENQIETAQNNMDSLKLEEENLIEEVQHKESLIQVHQKEIEELQNEVEAARAEKQKKLQILLHKQRQIKLYTDFTKGKFKPLFRTDLALKTELSEQNQLNSKLITVVECLINDFPQYSHIFRRLLNLLQLQFC